MTFAPQFTITNSMTAGLTRIERARGFLEAAHLSDDWIRSMGQRALSIQMLATSFPELNRRTLQRDLKGLIECGLIESGGATNRAKYRLCR